MNPKTLIIDERKTDVKQLQSQLNELSQKLDVVDTAFGIEDGYEKICLHSPDLIFLDTNYSNGTAFDLLKKFEKIEFKIIFTTSCDEYAFRAFKYNALDFLMKPIRTKPLENAVHKARLAIRKKYKINLKPKTKGYFLKNRKLAIKESKSINYIDIDDIVHLRADGNYTNIILNTGQNLISSKVLKHYDELLSEFGFLRVHRSNMINLNYVKEFRHKYGGSIVLKNNEEINIAPDKKKVFFNSLGMI